MRKKLPCFASHSNTGTNKSKCARTETSPGFRIAVYSRKQQAYNKDCNPITIPAVVYFKMFAAEVCRAVSIPQILDFVSALSLFYWSSYGLMHRRK